MFYFALFLIFAGLACLLYLFVIFFVSPKEKEQSSGETVRVPKPPKQPDTTAQKTTVPVVKRQPVSAPKEPAQNDSGTVPKVRFPPVQKVVQNPEPDLKEYHDDEPDQQTPLSTPVITGVLFHDLNRRCIQAVDRWKEIPVDFYEEFKRIGPGTLHYSDGAFRIETDDSTHSYDIGDMEQILFLDGGLALIPTGRKAVPVFLTAESRRIKSFLAENSL